MTPVHVVMDDYRQAGAIWNATQSSSRHHAHQAARDDKETRP